MTDAEAVQFYFRLSAGSLVLILLAGGIWLEVSTHLTRKRIDAHIDQLLALPGERLKVWVSSYVSEYEMGEYIAYTLYSQVDGEKTEKISENNAVMKYFCQKMAAAGRPVASAPQWWRP